MKKNNAEMFASLRAFNLPVNEYLITGSGPLGIRNLKAIGDIDIVVSNQLWDILADQFGVTIDNDVQKIALPGGIVDAFYEKSFNPLLDAPNIRSRIENAEIIEGLPFDSLENTLFFKRKMGREKDLKDITLLEVALYKKRLKIPNATFCRIDHHDAMVAIVYKIIEPNGHERILKICERSSDYLKEAYFLNYFASKLPVPRIIQLVEPDTNLHGAILMECIPGVLLSTIQTSNKLAYEMGEALANIHLHRTSGYGDLIAQENFNSNPRIPFTMKFEEGMDECKDHLPKELLAKCRHYYEANLHLLDTVDGPCIIHRDFRAGNVLVNEGKLKGIIDWSSARSSFAEDDFCSLEHGEFPFDQESKTAFLSGYASVRVLPDYQAIMPFLRMNRALATIGFTVKRNTWATKDAKVYQYNRKYLETFIFPHA